MTSIMESVDFVRVIFRNYGSEFKGFYLAIIVTLIVIVVCNLKNRGIRSFVLYNVVVLSVMLILSFMDYALGFLPQGEFYKIYDIFPTIEVILLGFAVVSPFMLRNITDERKKNRAYIALVISTSFIVLVEGAVPLQITFKNFGSPREVASYTDEVAEIGDTIKDKTVVLPKELQIPIKEYNSSANMPFDITSDYGEEAASIFNFCQVSKVDYVVLKIQNNLGKTNEEALNAGATNYGYTLIKQVGDYLIYGSPNVV